MEIGQELATKVLPLYAFMMIGWVLKRKWDVGTRSISKLMLYVLIPFLIIENLLKADPQETVIVGSMVFLLALAMNLPAMWIQRSVGKDFDGNLLKGAFSYYNIGWFGIPIVMALFGEEQMPLIISAYVGNALYGDTIGYYLMSRTKGLSLKAAIGKIFKIPAIYACVAAALLQVADVSLPHPVEAVGEVVSWGVSALGMLIIGLTLGSIKFKNIAYVSLTKILGSRYIAGALFLGLLIFAEHQFIGTLDGDQMKLMLLLASFPIATNLVVFASYLQTEERNTAVLVGLSSITSLALAPLVSILLF